MAEIGLAEASRLTGKNRSTLHRAMKAGRLSYAVNDAGERRIDVAELQRIFELRPDAMGHINGATVEATPEAMRRNSAQRGEVAALQQLIESQDATICDLRATIARQREDLRQATEERRRLLAMITDRRPWWRRWLR
jgi:septal ring factor EnvC (AmiA/AmiB activator)